MAWIESHVDLGHHPKVLNLAAIMGWSVREAVGALHLLWHWCVDYAEDGDLRRYNDGVIASVVALNPDDGHRFVEALVHCGGEVASGFIDREPYFRIHDWWDYVGAYLQSKYRHNSAKWKRIQKMYKTPSKTCQRRNITVGKGRSLVGSEEEGDSKGGVDPPLFKPPGNGRSPEWPSPQKLVELYNLLTPKECPAVTIVSPSRIEKARKYLKVFPAEEFWREVFKQVHRSKFLRGLVKNEGHGNFVADFDWLLTKGKDGTENVVKVFDGRYVDEGR